MKIQQHVYDKERNRKEHKLQRSLIKRTRPKSKSNLNIINQIDHGKKEVSL